MHRHINTHVNTNKIKQNLKPNKNCMTKKQKTKKKSSTSRGPTAATLDKDRNRYGFQSANDGAEHRYDAGSSTNAIPYGSTGIGSTSRYWSGNSGYGGSRDRLNVGGMYLLSFNPQARGLFF